jgi:quinol monooxygenase YgiN
VAIKKGELDAARATYERAVLPVLRASGALVTASVLVDDEASTLTALSTWRDDGAFAAVAATPEYGAAIAELVAHFRDADGVPASVDVGHYAYDGGEAPE